VKNSANITLDLSSPAIYVGENITVTGSIPVGDANVTLMYDMLNFTSSNGSLLNHTASDSAVSRLVSTSSSGVFSDVFSSTQTGTWIVMAIWNGSDTYFGASSGYVNFTVQKVVMSITCNVTSESITIGDNITVTGSIYPKIENLTVTVTFIGANSTVTQTAYTNSNGTFLVSWKPDSMGLWQVHSHIAEGAAMSQAYSSSLSFTVNDTWLNQYMLFIIGGAGGGAAVPAVIFFVRRRRYG
jgi:hypothetical protein